MPFKKGEIHNPKGAPRGGKGGPGRPPDWLKEECKKAVEKDNLIGFLSSVARGDEIETSTIYGLQGNKIAEKKSAADTKDRIRAVELLLDRGWGKPAQAVEHSGSIGGRSDEEKAQDRSEVQAYIDGLLKRK